MSDQAKINAEAAKARILSRLQALEEEAGKLREQLAAVNGFLSVFEKFETLNPNDPLPTPTYSTSTPAFTRRNPSRKDVADLALRAIEEKGRPMKRRELFEAVTKAGLDIVGKDPLVVFSTMLWREQEQIVRLDRFGYWPAGKPFPPAGYLPPQA